jgi:hypothetical protein
MFLLEWNSCLTWCRYERVLVDAPCSSDRHLANAPLQLAQWSQTHVAQAAALQVLQKLLLTLFLITMSYMRLVSELSVTQFYLHLFCRRNCWHRLSVAQPLELV